jgi:hypothetical protein
VHYFPFVPSSLQLLRLHTMALMLFPGARSQDVILWGRQHVQLGYIRYVPEKTTYIRKDAIGEADPA